MSQLDCSETFAFLNERVEPLLAKRSVTIPRRRFNPRRLVVPVLGISAHAFILVFFLNFAGVVRIPRMEGMTRERLFGVPVAPPSPRPAAAPAVQPAVQAQTRSAPPSRLTATQTSFVRNPSRAPAPPIRPQSPAPVPTQQPTFDAPAAEALLSAHDLVRGANGYVLESEANVLRNLADLKTSYEACSLAYDRAERYFEAQNLINQYDPQINSADAKIKQLDILMSQFPTVWSRGVKYRGFNNVQVDAFNQLKAERDQTALFHTNLTRERNEARLRIQSEGLNKAPDAYKRQKADTLEVVNSNRSALQAFRSEHEAAATHPEVIKALKRLGHGRLIPSPAFLSNIEGLIKFEQTLSLKATFPRADWPASWRTSP